MRIRYIVALLIITFVTYLMVQNSEDPKPFKFAGDDQIEQQAQDDRYYDLVEYCTSEADRRGIRGVAQIMQFRDACVQENR